MGTHTHMYPVSMFACLAMLGLGHSGTGRPSHGQNCGLKFEYKMQKNQNHKIHKFRNFEILHLNFILNIGYVNLNLSIFVELIDMDSWDQLQTEFNSDCEILAPRTKIY